GLVAELRVTAERYAGQLDNILFEIQLALGHDHPKETIIKEVGYRSIENGFIRPFEYSADTGILNIDHQAAAYEAVFLAFQESGYEWYEGIIWWDASISPDRHGPVDLGFSPLGKQKTEEVILQYFAR